MRSWAFQLGWKGCWLAPAAFLIDRATKGWAAGRLAGGAPIELWPGVLRLTYVENTGAAFGIFQGSTAALAWVTGGVLLALLVWLLLWGGRMPALPRHGLWLMLGGAAGNLWDRVACGAVIDFIEIRLFRFPVFNAADICVCIAFALLAGWIVLHREEKPDGG